MTLVKPMTPLDNRSIQSYSGTAVSTFKIMQSCWCILKDHFVEFLFTNVVTVASWSLPWLKWSHLSNAESRNVVISTFNILLADILYKIQQEITKGCIFSWAGPPGSPSPLLGCSPALGLRHNPGRSGWKKERRSGSACPQTFSCPQSDPHQKWPLPRSLGSSQQTHL